MKKESSETVIVRVTSLAGLYLKQCGAKKSIFGFEFPTGQTELVSWYITLHYHDYINTKDSRCKISCIYFHSCIGNLMDILCRSTAFQRCTSSCTLL